MPIEVHDVTDTPFKLIAVTNMLAELECDNSIVQGAESQLPILWEICPNGIVSLLDMLRFAAEDFVAISHRLGRLLGDPNKFLTDNTAAMTEDLIVLMQQCQKLGLAVTGTHLSELVLEFKKKNYKLPSDRVAHHIEAIQSTLQAELKSISFRGIPKEKLLYCNPLWLVDNPIDDSFPTSQKELQRAGHCYAFGESTACVFHSMRALEPGLTAIADAFGVDSKHENWQVVIQAVESEIRALGQQAKTPQKIADEKFFGEAVAHLYFVKNAWRNHVAHSRDTYGDDEALRIMQHVVEFVESLCPRLKEKGV